jgi:hypothetical protein
MQTSLFDQLTQTRKNFDIPSIPQHEENNILKRYFSLYNHNKAQKYICVTLSIKEIKSWAKRVAVVKKVKRRIGKRLSLP